MIYILFDKSLLLSTYVIMIIYLSCSDNEEIIVVTSILIVLHTSWRIHLAAFAREQGPEQRKRQAAAGTLGSFPSPSGIGRYIFLGTPLAAAVVVPTPSFRRQTYPSTLVFPLYTSIAPYFRIGVLKLYSSGCDEAKKIRFQNS